MAEPTPATTVSVVIPAWNAGDDLDRCLEAVFRSDFPLAEVIVVDDASTEPSTAEIAQRHGAKLLRMPRQSGPGQARNFGAREATGDVLLFTDADVVLHHNAIGKAVAVLEADPQVAAVFGSYDDAPAHPSLLSRYRNLYHHWNHQAGNEEASTFWTGLGAVKRAAFDAAGGFSPALSRMGMEDIDLGYRLRDAGFRILLVKDMLGTHLKAWSAFSMMRTDIFHRGVPWMLLLLARDGAPPDLNLGARSRWSTAAGGVLPLALILSPWWPPMLGVAIAALAVIVIFQWDYLRMVDGLKGRGFALACVPALALFFFCAAVSIPIGLLRHFSGRGLTGRLATPDQ